MGPNTDDARPSSAPVECLVVIDTPAAPSNLCRLYVLDRSAGRHVIGRASSAWLVMDDPGMARQHCALEFVAGTWRIYDHRTTNGTQVNGRDASKYPGWSNGYPLVDRDVIRVGLTFLRYRIGIIEEVYASEAAWLVEHDGATGALRPASFRAALEREVQAVPDRSVPVLLVALADPEDLEAWLGIAGLTTIIGALAHGLVAALPCGAQVGRQGRDRFVALCPGSEAKVVCTAADALVASILQDGLDCSQEGRLDVRLHIDLVEGDAATLPSRYRHAVGRVRIDPLADLVEMLRADGPPFWWVVEWSQRGREPLTAAWARSRDGIAMTRVLAMAGHEALPRLLAAALGPLERMLEGPAAGGADRSGLEQGVAHLRDALAAYRAADATSGQVRLASALSSSPCGGRGRLSHALARAAASEGITPPTLAAVLARGPRR